MAKVYLGRRLVRVLAPEHPEYGRRLGRAWTVVGSGPVSLDVDEPPPLGWIWNGDVTSPGFYKAMVIGETA